MGREVLGGASVALPQRADPGLGGRICFYFFVQFLDQLQDELALARRFSSRVHYTQVYWREPVSQAVLELRVPVR